MPAHKRPDTQLKLVRDIIHDCLREGYAPPDLPVKGRAAHSEAVRRLEELGHKAGTVWSWIGSLRGTKWEPNYGLYRPFQYQAVREGRKVLPAYRPPDVLTPENKGRRVGLIGDMHDSPELTDKSRFYWIGRWLAEQGFDEAVQVGDIATLDSLTRHAAPGTKSFSELPTFQQDLLSLDEALSELDRGLGRCKIRKTITLGNHEYRAVKYEDNNPQMVGTVCDALLAVLRKHGWNPIPFKEIYFVEGVGITHHPVNLMGGAYGGKTANRAAGNDLTFPLIHGHDHKREVVSCAKIGPQGFIETVSVGCALPWGHVEDYAKHGPSGWWWGVCGALLSQGQILDYNFTSMLTLQDKYAETKKKAA